MWNTNQKPDGMGKGSAVYSAISALYAALGIIVAILATKPLFELTRKFLFLYLAKQYGNDPAEILLWILGGCEAFILYISTKLILTSLTIYGMAALAARRFPAG